MRTRSISSTPSTAIPRTRKGRRRNQTNGYRTNARSARGQHRNNRISHKRNFVMRMLRSNIELERALQEIFLSLP